jgi:hypothetical protein
LINQSNLTSKLIDESIRNILAPISVTKNRYYSGTPLSPTLSPTKGRKGARSSFEVPSPRLRGRGDLGVKGELLPKINEYKPNTHLYFVQVFSLNIKKAATLSVEEIEKGMKLTQDVSQEKIAAQNSVRYKNDADSTSFSGYSTFSYFFAATPKMPALILTNTGKFSGMLNCRFFEFPKQNPRKNYFYGGIAPQEEISYSEWSN